MEDSSISKGKQAKLELLRNITEILHDNYIPYFLTAGTLLGAMREKDFIDWDTDIDLGCFDVDSIFALKEEFAKAGLAIHIYYAASKYVAKQVRIEKITDSYYVSPNNKLHCDIFQFDITPKGYIFRYNIHTKLQRKIVKILNKVYYVLAGKEHIIHGVSPSEETSVVRRLIEMHNVLMCKQGIHIFKPFSLVWYDFLGLPVFIPEKYDAHLTLFYGDTWRTPNPNYKSSEERQKNIRRVSL